MLPKCDIVKLVYKDESERVYKCDGKNQINIPVAVLVNSGSASASEILASAIKDSNTGVLIGTKTYGKGIVQEVQQLDGKGALSITVAKYYTASGVEIHKNGIEPNITVELPEEYQKSSSVPRDKDTQLIKAIEYINSKK
jgi:carboxyl-terminal processing protease